MNFLFYFFYFIESNSNNPENYQNEGTSLDNSYIDVNPNNNNVRNESNGYHDLNVDVPNMKNMGTNIKMILHNRSGYCVIHSLSEGSSDEEIPPINSRIGYYEVYSPSEGSSDDELPLIQYT
nr:unnamed protein product [Callosobruchus analis]